MLYLIIAENGGRHMASKVFEQYVVLKITSKQFIFFNCFLQSQAVSLEVQKEREWGLSGQLRAFQGRTENRKLETETCKREEACACRCVWEGGLSPPRPQPQMEPLKASGNLTLVVSKL